VAVVTVPHSKHAVVIVSGGDAVSPYTTPISACASGLSAGNTNTYIRERLLEAGFAVYTAPAMNARTQVVDAEPGSFGAFGGQPEVLPAHMTIVSNGDIDNAGEHLTRFISHLHNVEGVTHISWVAHSNGGLFATSATRIMKETESPVSVIALAALGTPWMGTLPLQVGLGELSEAVLMGDQQALAISKEITKHAEQGGDLGLAQQDTYRYLLGEKGWLAAQAGVLSEVPVLLIAGTKLFHPQGEEAFWPFDSLVSEYSALARGVPAEVIPLRQEASFDVYHSIFFADQFKQPWESAMTWNPQVLDSVVKFLTQIGSR